ncbi:MAG: DUF1499 domain-containing protein [Alphaproteobacteria bacterium]|nr:DUF1499 domain-containing protein [Alphaproteobacteria bacterium]
MPTSERIDFETLKRARTPNTFLMAPEGLCKNAKIDMAAPVYAVPAAKLRQEFLSVAIAQPRTSHVFADEPGLYDDFVVRSALFRFPDLVAVKFIDLKGKTSTLALYSRSVYGRSDLGVNRKRSLAWLAQLSVAAKPVKG